MLSFRWHRRLVAAVGLAIAVPAAAGEESANAPEPAVVLPATGQTESYPVARRNEPEPATVADDGYLRAGAPLRYRDNEDGTITDLTTGLMWEKKCAGCDGPHDHRLRLRWSGDGKDATIWDWLDQLNAEGGKGFAGHDDWRVPNVKELVSIVNYGRVNPALDGIFATSTCAAGCDDVTASACSCTAIGEYWTSTTFSDFPAHAIIVDLGLGFVDDRLKTNRHLVRAVRGGR